MPRDHAQVNVAIWGDPDFRDLPWQAQHLYFLLWSSPKLTYCGTHDWRPARLSGFASNLTKADVQAAADCLAARWFVVVDEDTEEILLRSWIRFDGLIKQPRMAISAINAYSAVASPLIRSVVVNELHRIRNDSPDLTAWRDDRMIAALDHPRADPKGWATPEDPFGVPVTPGFTPGVTPGLGEAAGSVWGSAKGVPTPAPTPAPLLHSSQAQRIDSVERESDPIADDFDEWWKAYPRKRGKGQAVRAYRAARKLASASELLKAIAEQTPNLTAKGDEFVPYPATWLNGQRWDDDLTTASNRPGGSPALPTYMQVGHPDYNPNFAATAGRS